MLRINFTSQLPGLCGSLPFCVDSAPYPPVFALEWTASVLSVPFFSFLCFNCTVLSDAFFRGGVK